MIKLAAFLGNPGLKYAFNRHNAGQMLAQKFPFSPSLSWQKKFKGLFAHHEGTCFLLPETYMNISGTSVLAAASFFKINVDEIIVIHDELELPLGCVSLKFSGGLGGHNGLRSMKECFGSADFWRIRVGIGRPEGNISVYDWVLSDFSKTEQELLIPTLEAGAELLTQVFAGEPEALLKEWAKKKITSFEQKFEQENETENGSK
ncbi:MAG: aminoacyl-tRNA hydrolase [Treponema sp.]|jgi:PTH1 family peptidyl-tRNA hydrolase|nr:aminoacyl-tRNA hydrolase [Treponema sp.]